MMDERELAAAVKRGDAAACEELVRRYQAPLRALARRLAPSPDQADDLAQETFLQAFRALKTWRGEGELGAWLRGILRNQSRLMWRKLARRDKHERDGLAEYIANLAEETCAVDPLVLAEQRVALGACLDLLQDKARQLIELRHQHGLSCEEVAEIVSSKAGAVRTSLCRLHKRLRDCVQGRLAGERPDV